jgi:hypothetical protein
MARRTELVSWMGGAKTPAFLRPGPLLLYFTIMPNPTTITCGLRKKNCFTYTKKQLIIGPVSKPQVLKQRSNTNS